jgi:carbon monoxide dehydrogenase subunit G
MPINITETFELAAPVDRVWEFLLDPREVVVCMPGAALDEVVDERTFLGTIRVKVGPIVTSYRGRVQFVDVDRAAYRIEMTAEGREAAGSGNARATMTSNLDALPGGGTRVIAQTRAEITGRVMQFGQSMIEGVSHQLFLEFVKRAKERLDAAPVAPHVPPRDNPVPAPASTQQREPEAVAIVPMLLRATWRALSSAIRRLVHAGRARSSE